MAGGGGITLAGVTLYSRITVCVCVCVCLCLCVCVDRFLCPWDFPGKNTGVGCPFLLQGIFQPRDQTRISCVSYIGKWILYYCANWESQIDRLDFFLEVFPIHLVTFFFFLPLLAFLSLKMSSDRPTSLQNVSMFQNDSSTTDFYLYLPQF